jgi:hypothetical protein
MFLMLMPNKAIQVSSVCAIMSYVKTRNAVILVSYLRILKMWFQYHAVWFVIVLQCAVGMGADKRGKAGHLFPPLNLGKK